jgi:AraC-like DNA-binding protein
MRRIILILVMLVSSSAFAADTGSVVISDYSKIIQLSGKAVVRVIDGDNDNFAKAEYDDSSWKKITLPENMASVFPGNPKVCWYRIHLVFPDNLPNNSIGISLGIISDTDETYFNGILIGKTGDEKVHAYDKKRIYELPQNLIIQGKDNVIAIKTIRYFNNESGMNAGNIYIAHLKKLYYDFFSKEFTDLIFVALYLIVALYFSVLFISKTIDREYLFFSLFTILTAVYLFLRTQIKYFVIDDFTLLKRIEYITLFLIPVFMMEYIRYYFNRQRRNYHYIYYVFIAIASAIIVFSSDIRLWNNLLLYSVEPSWIFPIGYSAVVCLHEIKKTHDAKYLFATFIIILCAFINDVLYDRGFIHSMRVSTYGFMAVIAGTAIIMRGKFRHLYETAQEFGSHRRGLSSIIPENREKMERAIKYIRENFREDISREGLAASIEMHEDYFGKTFKNFTGMRMGDYINELRIHEACRLLLEGDRKVIDIAHEVGFDSLSTFYRTFQSVKKEKPVDWQKRNRVSVQQEGDNL